MRRHPLLMPLLLCHMLGVTLILPAEAPPSGRNLQVNPQTGADTNDGITQPVKTIARGVRLTLPGDTLHLAPGTYYESLDLSLKQGEPDRRITVDGHGAVLDGSEPVWAADWESLGQGLFRKTKIIPSMNPAVVGRWFFLWNGKMSHMGRTSKGPSAALKKPADLLPNEWTYVAEEDAFYLKLPEGQDLDTAKIRYPARSNGVVFSRSGAHLTVKNVTSTHVWNDGFNVHGAQRGLKFENIAAIECGDDGFSAHEDAQCEIDGFASIGNSTGLCDVGESVTHYRNVFIKDCMGHDVFFIGLDHLLENAVIDSSARYAFSFDGSRLPEGKTARLRVKNVLLRRTGGGVQEIRVGARGQLEAERCTVEGLNVTITPGASVTFQSSVFTGTPKANVVIWPNVSWSGKANVYDIAALRVDKTSFTAATFADFQKLISSEENSTWGAPAAPLTA
ncbi:MAG: hypothetical protein ACAI34_11655, partial [Verrucomicrobium sp.]